ncbi:MAG TPA: hypothetical protein VH300_00980 [Thermoleophilaceae bacterium]|nr:hypothetical protein [Thermoleophilaceae bacterium]
MGVRCLIVDDNRVFLEAAGFLPKRELSAQAVRRVVNAHRPR